MAISEAARKARFERWEKMGLERVKHGLLNDPLGVIGGAPEVRDLAWEWVREEEAKAAKARENKSDVLTLKPGMWGVSVDLKEAGKQIKDRFTKDND